MKLSVKELDLIDSGLSWILDQHYHGDGVAVTEVEALRKRVSIARRSVVASEKHNVGERMRAKHED